MRRSTSLLVAIAVFASSGAPVVADSAKTTEKLGEALRSMLEDMGPALDQALEMMRAFDGLQGLDDPRHYQLPEVLPNGDIIIRRKENAPAFRPKEAPSAPPPEDGSIQL